MLQRGPVCRTPAACFCCRVLVGCTHPLVAQHLGLVAKRTFVVVAGGCTKTLWEGVGFCGFVFFSDRLNCASWRLRLASFLWSSFGPLLFQTDCEDQGMRNQKEEKTGVAKSIISAPEQHGEPRKPAATERIRNMRLLLQVVGGGEREVGSLRLACDCKIPCVCVLGQGAFLQTLAWFFLRVVLVFLEILRGFLVGPLPVSCWDPCVFVAGAPAFSKGGRARTSAWLPC